jgi:hypothetical protein
VPRLKPVWASASYSQRHQRSHDVLNGGHFFYPLLIVRETNLLIFFHTQTQHKQPFFLSGHLNSLFISHFYGVLDSAMGRKDIKASKGRSAGFIGNIETQGVRVSYFWDITLGRATAQPRLCCIIFLFFLIWRGLASTKNGPFNHARFRGNFFLVSAMLCGRRLMGRELWVGAPRISGLEWELGLLLRE